ncbi:MAG TPA: ubiquinol-cytochrome C chaperone family protein [Rhodospirillales bacterium]
MPLWSFLAERARLRQSATELYGSIVAQARDPAPYRDLGVPDTAEARLEMLLLHLALVLLRLRLDGAAADRIARTLAETFVSDMDACMREMGIGDLTVPRKVKKAVAALYDRMHDYGEALADPDEALSRLVAAHVFGDPAAPGAKPLAAFARAMSGGLARQPFAELLAGRIEFPAW